MAAERKAIIFYRCNLFNFWFRQHIWKTSHEISAKLSQYCGSVILLYLCYKCPIKISGPPKFVAQKHQILDHFFHYFCTRHRISL